MVKSLPARVVLLLIAMTGLGVLAIRAEETEVAHMWPVGLAAGVLLIVPRRTVPYVALLVWSTAAVGIWAGGRPGPVVLGFATMVLVEAMVIYRVLSSADGPASLRDNRDLARYAGASALAAASGGLVGGLTSVLTGYGSPLLVMGVLSVSHLASLLVLLPFFLATSRHRGTAGPWERWAQLLLTVLVTVAVFLPTHVPSLIFLVIPLLGWGALRVGVLEAGFRLLIVALLADILSGNGHGPFADTSTHYGLAPGVEAIFLELFLVACALTSVPLALAVGQQQRRAREASNERSRLERVVGNTVGTAIIGTDELGRITLFNPGAENLLGYRAAEVLGRSAVMFQDEADVAAQARLLGVDATFWDVVGALAAVGGATRRDWSFRRKDGETRKASLSLAAINEDGGITGYVATADDVTEQVNLQQALIGALVTEREATDRLRQVDGVKDALVSTVSHELRTPITNILGYTEMLEDGEFGTLTQPQASALTRVSLNCRRLLTLVDDLLTLSRLQEDGLGRVTKDFDLRQVILAACDVIAPSLEGRSLGFEVDLPDDPADHRGDPDRLERMLVNLLSNAVKFTPNGGSVTIRLVVQEHDAVVEVIDTGVGIPLDEQDGLFSRFFRSSIAASHAIQGTGLGLSIVKSIVEQHSGVIDVVSLPGRGTTFRVVLPRR